MGGGFGLDRGGGGSVLGGMHRRHWHPKVAKEMFDNFPQENHFSPANGYTVRVPVSGGVFACRGGMSRAPCLATHPPSGPGPGASPPGGDPVRVAPAL